MLPGEKEGLEKAIEMKMGKQVEILTNQQSADEDFNQALLDLCSLNKLRDALDQKS